MLTSVILAILEVNRGVRATLGTLGQVGAGTMGSGISSDALGLEHPHTPPAARGGGVGSVPRAEVLRPSLAAMRHLLELLVLEKVAAIQRQEKLPRGAPNPCWGYPKVRPGPT